MSPLPGRVLLLAARLSRGMRRYFLRPLFQSCGDNVKFDPGDYFTYSTITLGNDVYIGPGAHFSASNSAITIGNKVMFGPGVTIIGGDHNTAEVGRYMKDVKEKRPQDDQPVFIHDDVWVGANATILKGVVIGSGSIIAAGALVIDSVAENSIVGGVPARLLKPRFSKEQLQQHRTLLKQQTRPAFAK
ncbi:MAG TPA: galactoside O-acetyltransferase [Gammaproteobacteria bacterium]|nr:galactoside O-acetyltransferase [Gammaproteobacteria bacterium]